MRQGPVATAPLLSLTLILAGSFALASEPVLFVQGSRVNLRAEPSTSAPAVSQLVAGTPCEALEKNPDGWVKVRTPAATGWMKATLLGEAPPRYEALIAAARDPARSPGDRLDQALRAVVLQPDAPEARGLARDAFVEAERASLAAHPPPKEGAAWIVFTCSEDSPSRCLRDAVIDYLPPGDGVWVLTSSAPWVVTQIKKGCGGMTVLALGDAELFKGGTPSGFQARVMRRYDLSTNPELQLALTNTRTPRGCEPLSALKPSAQPALPKEWQELAGNRGDFFRVVSCGEVTRISLGLEGGSATMAIDQGGSVIRYSGSGPTVTGREFSFAFGSGTCTVEWPYKDLADVGWLNCPWRHAFITPVDRAKKFRVVRICERDEQ